MKSTRIKNLMSLGAAAALAVLAAGSIDSGTMSELFSEVEAEMQKDWHPQGIPRGNDVLNRSGQGTKLQTAKHQRENLNKAFDFAGFVFDVTKTDTAIIQLDPSNYADVRFLHSVEHLNKGEYVRFTGTIEGFGSGVLFHHEVTRARLAGK